jgi:hypothetical protein
VLHHVSEHNVMVVKTMGHKFVRRPRHKRLSFELFKYPPLRNRFASRFRDDAEVGCTLLRWTTKRETSSAQFVALCREFPVARTAECGP